MYNEFEILESLFDEPITDEVEFPLEKRADRRYRTRMKYRNRLAKTKYNGIDNMREKYQKKYKKLLRNTPTLSKAGKWDWMDYNATEKKSLNPMGAVNKRELFHKAMLEVNEDTAEEARRIAIEANPPYYVETYRGNLIQFTYNPDTDKYEPLFIPKSLNDSDRCLELSYMLEGKFTLLFGYYPEKLNGEKVNGNYSRWDEQKSKSWDEIWNDIFEYDTEMMLREMENESMAIFRNETKTSDWDDLDVLYKEDLKRKYEEDDFNDTYRERRFRCD